MWIWKLYYSILHWWKLFEIIECGSEVQVMSCMLQAQAVITGELTLSQLRECPSTWNLSALKTISGFWLWRTGGHVTHSYGEAFISLQKFFSACSNLTSVYHFLQELDHPGSCCKDSDHGGCEVLWHFSWSKHSEWLRIEHWFEDHRDPS